MLDKVLLFPYWLSLKIRHFLYDKGLRKVRKAEVPTISVGNVTVGGTGKTPHTEMILRLLLDSVNWGGKNIAVLSRGYKRESKGFQQVTPQGGATMFGDEPMQIKKKFPIVTVAVDADRVEGCDFLVHPDKLQSSRRSARRCWDKNFPPADLVVLDDAFQYRRLKADLNIVLVDYNRPVYKDHLLPLGRLRDLPERLGEADIIIVSKCPYELNSWEKTSFAYTLGLRDFATSTCSGTTAAGKTQKVFFTKVEYDGFQPMFENSDNRYIYSKRLVLFTGIAKDSPLRCYLSANYKIVRHLSFPDHHRFTWSDFQKIQHAVNRWPTAAIATTEKDAQRVLDFNGLPHPLRERMFQIPIRVVFLSEEEKSMFAGILENFAGN